MKCLRPSWRMVCVSSWQSLWLSHLQHGNPSSAIGGCIFPKKCENIKFLKTKTKLMYSNKTICNNTCVYNGMSSIYSHKLSWEMSNYITIQWIHIWEVTGSNLGPGDWLPWMRLLWFSSVSPHKCWDSTLKLDHDHFLLSPYQFIIHLSPLHLMLYILSYWKASLSKP
jgi:hypothetical protein